MGFKLKFIEDNGDTVSEASIPSQYQGFDGVVHGGIVATFLDEIMAQSVKKSGQKAMTGTLTVNYIKPCRTDEKIQILGRIVESMVELLKPRAR